MLGNEESSCLTQNIGARSPGPNADNHIIKPKSTIMKLKSMTSIITKSALVLAACASLNAVAGTSAPSAKGTIAPQPTEDGALFDTVGASLDVGYDTRYYQRGLYRADNTISVGLGIDIPLTEQLSLDLGARYINSLQNRQIAGLDTEFSELDLSAGLSYDVGAAVIGLVYNRYEYLDGFSGSVNGINLGGNSEFGIGSANEVGLTVATTLGPVNFNAGYFYDFTIGGSYAQIGADLPIEITPWLSLVPAVQLGYGFDYYTLPALGGRSSGLTHIVPSLSAPIKLTKSATLTPYVAYNISLDSRHNAVGAASALINGNAQDNEIFGGVRLSVSF